MVEPYNGTLVSTKKNKLLTHATSDLTCIVQRERSQTEEAAHVGSHLDDILGRPKAIGKESGVVAKGWGECEDIKRKLRMLELFHLFILMVVTSQTL